MYRSALRVRDRCRCFAAGSASRADQVHLDAVPFKLTAFDSWRRFLAWQREAVPAPLSADAKVQATFVPFELGPR
jgi:hypothetical protein